MSIEVLRAALAALERGEPAVLATVVRVEGSAYRRPGARMLIPGRGPSVGMVSGGCLESDLAERARRVLDGGGPTTVVYDMRSPDDLIWGLGLGCNGEVRVLIERIDRGSVAGSMRFLVDCLETRRPGLHAVVFEIGAGAAAPGSVAVGDRLWADASGRVLHPFADRRLTSAVMERAGESAARSGAAVRRFDTGTGVVGVLLERVAPPPALLVFGAGSDAEPLVRMAAGLGWSVDLYDHRAGLLTRERFPTARSRAVVDYGRLAESAPPVDERTAAVVMTHHFLHDLAILTHLAPRGLRYLGLLGPRRRTENLLEQLRSSGVDPDPSVRASLHGPTGLDVGAETPEEIALSILAEVQAVLAGRSGGALRDREAPLHDVGGGSEA